MKNSFLAFFMFALAISSDSTALKNKVINNDQDLTILAGAMVCKELDGHPSSGARDWIEHLVYSKVDELRKEHRENTEKFEDYLACKGLDSDQQKQITAHEDFDPEVFRRFKDIALEDAEEQILNLLSSNDSDRETYRGHVKNLIKDDQPFSKETIKNLLGVRIDSSFNTIARFCNILTKHIVETQNVSLEDIKSLGAAEIL